MYRSSVELHNLSYDDHEVRSAVEDIISISEQGWRTRAICHTFTYLQNPN